MWDVAEGDFLDPANWAGGVLPGGGDNAVVSNGGTATLSDGSITVSQLWAGQSNYGTATGSFIQTGGQLILNAGGISGRQAGAVGSWTMTGGSLQTVDFRVGGGPATATAPNTSQGTMSVSGGESVVTSTGFVGIGTTGTGTLTLSNNALWIHNGGTVFLVGGDNLGSPQAGGTGTLNVESGAELVFGGGANLSIGRNTSETVTTGNGTLNVNGGSITLGGGSLNLASRQGPTQLAGTGTLNMNSGNITSANGIRMNEGNSTLNFNGGVVTVGSIQKNATSGTGIVNFNGGTIQASASSANFIGMAEGTGSGVLTLNVLEGGAIVDTNGFEITIAHGMSGAGGLTKVGDGTLTLSGANGYAGATVVQAGTLALGADDVIADASDLTLNSATLDLAGFSDTMGALALDGTATINFGLVPGANSLVFADSSGATWSGSLVLENFEVGVDTLSFSDGSGLTLSQLDAIQLAGFTVTGLDANGVVQFSAIPEPSQFAMVMVGGLVVVIATARRRRRANA